MQGNTIYGQKLAGWDVVAALLGLGVMLAIQSIWPDSWDHGILWMGAPAAAILARRRFLPQLTPRSDVPTTPSTPLRRASGYLLMIGGGFVMLIDGVIAWIALSDRAPLPIAITLSIFAVAGWIASLGYRRVA